MSPRFRTSTAANCIAGASVGFALLLGIACSEPAGSQPDPTTGSDGPQTAPPPPPPPSGSTSSGFADSTSGDGEPTQVETTDRGDDESSTGELVFDVSFVTYPQQPMVVDIVFTAPGLDAMVIASDPAIHTAPVVGRADETRWRARGLAPNSIYTLQWSAADDNGSFNVRTEPALPGYLPSFPVQGDPSGLDGYLLFDQLTVDRDPIASLFVIDEQGSTRWHLGEARQNLDPTSVFSAAQLRADGTILYVREYALVIIDELGNALLTLDPSVVGVALHHDVVELDNGNFLTLGHAFRDIVYPDIGLTQVAGDLVLEVTPLGDIVWEWDSFDHLDPQRRLPGFEATILNPETDEPAQDWTHSSGLVYDDETDSVLLSVRNQDWLLSIDRASGDILWRMGPEGDFALDAGTWFHHQHSPQWQPDGSLLVYDNGVGNPDVDDPLETSRAVRYDIDVETMTAAQVWEDAAEDFLAPTAGDANGLPDGTLLITDSSIDFAVGTSYARIRKVDEALAEPLWSLTTEVGTFVYRCVVVPLLPGEAR